MTTNQRPLRHAILPALLVALASGGAAGPDDTAPIRELLDTQVREWNAGNLDGFMTTYWNSPKLVFQSGGTRSDGWETVRARYHKSYKAEGKEMGRLVFRNLEIESIAADAALARGRWELTMADGKTPGGLFTLILRKLPEGWRIVHDHTSADPKP